MPNTFFDTFDSAERVPRDPCRRAGDNPESAAALERVAPHLTEARAAVLGAIRDAGPGGATLKEVCASLGKTPNECSGRITELIAEGRIYRYGRRDGCAICHVRDA